MGNPPDGAVGLVGDFPVQRGDVFCMISQIVPQVLEKVQIPVGDVNTQLPCLDVGQNVSFVVKVNDVSVSYTHLTLPTIYSV